MSIQYLKGDATAPAGSGPTIIAHICNDSGGRGRGFVLAISARWPQPEARYREWHKAGADAGFRLGAVQLVQVGESAWVANMVAQAGTRPTKQ
ncbi:MAG: Appr-1-p processing protein, partial [Planctomycetes bacterium]|nr:Appr-1-p processing protein [Planctomycetota bacterium]